MDHSLQNLLSSSLLVCIKDSDSKILYQSPACQQTCGSRSNQICKEGCMNLYDKSASFPTFAEGIQFFQSQVLDHGVYDVALINDKDRITSILYPLDEKHQDELNLLKSYALSTREKEIMRYVVLGANNNSICKKLEITRATLKTHLNNIYKKLPNSMAERFKKRGI